MKTTKIGMVCGFPVVYRDNAVYVRGTNIVIYGCKDIKMAIEKAKLILVHFSEK